MPIAEGRLAQGPHVLIVDDSPADRSWLRSVLARDPRHRWQIEEASTRADALVALGRRIPDAAFLDLRLPDASGFEILADLRRLGGDVVPVVMLSGSGDEDAAAAAIKEGALDYLSKDDLPPERLLRSLGQAIETMRVRREAERIEARVRGLAEATAEMVHAGRSVSGIAAVTARHCGSCCEAVALVRLFTGNGDFLYDAASSEAHAQLGSERSVDEAPEMAAFEPGWVERTLTTPDGSSSWFATPIPLPAEVLAVPLESATRRIGVLVLHRSGPAWSAEERSFVFALAERAALAIDNARLVHELEEALRSRDELFAMASHDLKAPLAVIRAGAQLLARQGSSRQIDRILRSSDQMASLIEDILDTMRMEGAAPLPLQRAPTDLAELVRERIANARGVTGRHRIELKLGDEPLVGCWDGRRIERVFDNLISNAIKYSPAGGTIEIGAGRDGEDAIFWVRDEGLGIPADEQRRIFERFHRGRNVSGRIPGSGIGLASSLRVVQEHGGSVRVISTEGVGSTFLVRLPLGDVASCPAPL